MSPDGTMLDPDLGIREAARRLREALASAEEAEARAHERVEALRTALRQVEALVAPWGQAGTQAPGNAHGTAATSSPGGSGSERPVPGGARRQTATEAIRDLLTYDPRPWNATEIVSTVARSEGLARLRDPVEAARAALRRMVARGEVVRVGRGYYQTASAPPRPPLAWLGDAKDRPPLFLAEQATDDPKEDAP